MVVLFQSTQSCISCRVPQLGFDAQELVVFRLSVRSCWSAGLDDILSWVIGSNNRAQFSLLGRGNWLPTPNGYIGGLILNYNDIPGNLCLIISDGATRWDGPTFNIGAIPPPYRLESSGAGAKLRLRVLDLTTKGVIQEMTVTDATLAQGLCGLYVDMAENLAESHQVEVDNFYINGTKP